MNHFTEYIKLMDESRSLYMKTRNYHILKDYLDMGNFCWRDIAQCFDLCVGRVQQIIRQQLLVFNHIVRTDNPITTKEIKKRREDEWFYKDNSRRLLLEAYLKFRILTAEQRTSEVEKLLKGLLYVKR